MDLVNYVTYNTSTGEITQWGRGIAPRSVPWIENTETDLTNFRVNLQTLSLEPKTEVTLTINKSEAQADGQDAIQITGIPTDTLVSFSVGRVNYANYIQDGELEITSPVPELVTLTWYHGLYIMAKTQVEFI